MALPTRSITQTMFGADGNELSDYISIAKLSNDETDTANKHVRVNDTPPMQFTANASGVATLLLPDNIDISSYTISSYPAGTTEFIETNKIYQAAIRVAGSDSDLVDILI